MPGSCLYPGPLKLGRTSEESVYGVTLDDLTKLDAIVASLQNLPYKPTVRVVFDPGTSAADYYAPLLRLHAVAYVMGEVYDSYYFPTDLATYKAGRRNWCRS